MIRGTFPTLRRRAAQARATQQRLLQHLQTLDDACMAHMAHGAMSGADPLTDSLYGQLEAPAAEAALPAIPYTAGQQPQPQRPQRGWWMAGVTLLAALVSFCLLTPRA